MPRARKEVPAGAWFAGYQQILDKFPEGLVVEPSQLTAEDNRVAVIAEGQGTMTDGRASTTTSTTGTSRRTGIGSPWVREYGHTLHAQEILVDPAR